MSATCGAESSTSAETLLYPPHAVAGSQGSSIQSPRPGERLSVKKCSWMAATWLLCTTKCSLGGMSGNPNAVSYQ